MLGGIDLADWADESDLVRAEIRLLPVVQRFASDPKSVQKILGNNLSVRLREFNQGRDLNIEALRSLFADLTQAVGSPVLEATIDRISQVNWFDVVPGLGQNF